LKVKLPRIVFDDDTLTNNPSGRNEESVLGSVNLRVNEPKKLKNERIGHLVAAPRIQYHEWTVESRRYLVFGTRYFLDIGTDAGKRMKYSPERRLDQGPKGTATIERSTVREYEDGFKMALSKGILVGELVSKFRKSKKSDQKTEQEGENTQLLEIVPSEKPNQPRVEWTITLLDPDSMRSWFLNRPSNPQVPDEDLARAYTGKLGLFELVIRDISVESTVKLKFGIKPGSLEIYPYHGPLPRYSLGPAASRLFYGSFASRRANELFVESPLISKDFKLGLLT
jgi:hypothetical protein